ncbi:MAG: YfhO family protein [Deltaproteobacteria bacterium]|nr:YfhO family protein [Deltaproteobacteria bacterium]
MSGRGVSGEIATGERRPCDVGPWFIVAVLTIEAAAFIVVADLVPFARGIYHDNYHLSYPLRVLVSTALSDGVMPLWDHWSFAGGPFVSPATATSLSPLVAGISLFGVYGFGSFFCEVLLTHLFGVIGMVLWLRGFAGKMPTLLGAVLFGLSQYQAIQAPINVEGIASLAGFPWLALGGRLALEGRPSGIGVIALAAWQMFTAGYLGVNFVAAQFIAVFVLAERLATGGPTNLRAVLRGVLFALAGVALFVAIFNFPILEAWHHYNLDMTQIRETKVDPFEGSAQLGSLRSLLFPNGLSSFVARGPERAHIAALFIGAIGLFFVVYAALGVRRDRRVALLLVMAVVAFCAMLSREWWPGRFLTGAIPFFDQIRYHGWHAGTVVFFLAALAAAGARRFFDADEPRPAIAAVVLMVAASPVLLLTGDARSPDISRFIEFPQIWTFLGFLAVAFVLRHRVRLPVAKTVLLLCLVELVSTSFQYVRLSGRINVRPSPAVIAENERLKVAGFGPAENRRLMSAPREKSQYFAKQPAVVAYQPFAHPVGVRLAGDRALRDRLDHVFYPTERDGKPAMAMADEITIRRLTTASAEVEVLLSADVAEFVWSSPFTPNWKLTVDGAPHETRRTAHGLTAFELSSGRHDVVLQYQPPYLVPSLIVSGLAILFALALVLWGVRAKFRAWRHR